MPLNLALKPDQTHGLLRSKPQTHRFVWKWVASIMAIEIESLIESKFAGVLSYSQISLHDYHLMILMYHHVSICILSFSVLTMRWGSCMRRVRKSWSPSWDAAMELLWLMCHRWRLDKNNGIRKTSWTIWKKWWNVQNIQNILILLNPDSEGLCSQKMLRRGCSLWTCIWVETRVE